MNKLTDDLELLEIGTARGDGEPELHNAAVRVRKWCVSQRKQSSAAQVVLDMFLRFLGALSIRFNITIPEITAERRAALQRDPLALKEALDGWIHSACETLNQLRIPPPPVPDTSVIQAALAKHEAVVMISLMNYGLLILEDIRDGAGTLSHSTFPRCCTRHWQLWRIAENNVRSMQEEYGEESIVRMNTRLIHLAHAAWPDVPMEGY